MVYIWNRTIIEGLRSALFFVLRVDPISFKYQETFFFNLLAVVSFYDLQEGVQQLVLGLYIIRGDNMYVYVY